MSANRLVRAGALPCYQAVVGDMVGLVIKGAGDQDNVCFSHHCLTNLHAHVLIEPA